MKGALAYSDKSVGIGSADPGAPEFLAIHYAREAYAASLYPAESNHHLDVEAMRQPQMTFYGVWRDGKAIGCGGFWAFADYVEIKSVWIDQGARGLKLGRKLMAVIEDDARAKRFKIARLETGISQPEALGLYRALGYKEREPFGDYRPDPRSIFMEKAL